MQNIFCIGANVDIHGIGREVRRERIELGFSQSALARLSGLSRVTIGNLEAGKLNDLGFQKLLNLCEILGLNLGLSSQAPVHDWLKIAAQTSSTSYRSVLSSTQLQQILVSGIVPPDYAAHMMTLIEEAPPTVLLGAIKKAALDNAGDMQAVKRKIVAQIVNMAKLWKIKRFEI